MLSYLESLHCFQTDFFTSKVIFFRLKAVFISHYFVYLQRCCNEAQLENKVIWQRKKASTVHKSSRRTSAY